MAKDSKSQGIRLLSGMVVFIIISAFLWLTIKLSDTYTVTEPFAIHYVDVPADQIIPNDNYHFEATMTTTGFKLLQYYFKAKEKRKVDVSLTEIIYKKINFETYSYSARYLEEAVANYLGAGNVEVKLTDENQVFVMSRLVAKRVKIVPKTNFVFERQYNYYGEPAATPDSATIYGSFNEVAGINELNTGTITRKNVHQDVETKAKIELKGDIRCDISEVQVLANVEKFTEAEIQIPITVPGDVVLHLYPNTVKIKYIVAMKDYAIINDMSFQATINPEDIFQSETLPVSLTLSPNNTQIIGIYPEEVEYIIVQK